jgi:hypothetical protein
MSTSTPYPADRRPVRLPFRLLAGLIGIAFVFAAIGTLSMAWRGTQALTVMDILMLPLTAWFIRLMYHAVVSGTVPKGHVHWPLASRGVWDGYTALLLAYWIFRS